MSRAVAITVTKDEYDLIADWISHHAAIFGYTNIIVLDNGSSHPQVLDAYQTYRRMGVRIETRAGRFKHKSKWWTEVAKSLDADLVFPLDSDEFLVAPGARENSNAEIAQICDKLLVDPESSHFVIRHYLYSHVTGQEPWYPANQGALRPAHEIVHFRSTQVCNKCFFRPSAVKRIGTGNHFQECRVTWGKHAISTELALLHFHYTGERRRIERSWKLIYARGIVKHSDSLDKALRKLRRYKGKSVHAVQHIMQHLEQKKVLGAAAAESMLYAPSDNRTHGLEKGAHYHLITWPYLSQMLVKPVRLQR